MNLNRVHKGATIINISNNVIMKLYYYDLKKSNEYDYVPNLYIKYEKDAIFNVELISNTKKQKRKVKDGYYLNHVGTGNTKNLLDVKDKVYDIMCQLKHNEALTIVGADRRRHKVYKYYIKKDKRFDACAMFYEEGIALFNPYDDSWMDSFMKTLVKDKENQDILDWKKNKKVVRNRHEKWKEICR